MTQARTVCTAVARSAWAILVLVTEAATSAGAPSSAGRQQIQPSAASPSRPWVSVATGLLKRGELDRAERVIEARLAVVPKDVQALLGSARGAPSSLGSVP